MTIATSSSDLSIIDDLILQGYKRAGLLPLEFAIGADSNWNARAAHGRTTLNRLVNNLAVQGFIDHFVSFYVLQLIAGTSQYDIPAADDILNLVDNGSHIPTSNGSEVVKTTGETPVMPISRHKWNQYSSKVASGTPTMYYLHRNGPNLSVFLWPVPSAASKIRFQAHRIPGSSSTGSNTPDLQRHWDTWIVNALAVEFMMDAKLPADEVGLIRSERDSQLALLKSYETQNTSADVLFVHSTPWSYGRGY